MEKNIIDGAELDVDFKIEAGSIVFMPKYAGKGGYAKMELGVDAEYFLKELAKKIPGTFDDAVIAIAIQAIKAL